MKIKRLLIVAGVLILGFHLGCAHMGDQPAGAKKAEIKKILAPEVEVTGFKYYLDKKCKISKKDCLTFEITLKNVSDKPQRFITRITLPDEGKSVGGFVPRKGKKDKKTGKKKPPVIDPGKTAKAKYPVFYYDQPKKIEVEVTVY